MRKKLKKQIYSYDNLVYGIFDKIFNKVSNDMVDMVDLQSIDIKLFKRDNVHKQYSLLYVVLNSYCIQILILL